MLLIKNGRIFDNKRGFIKGDLLVSNRLICEISPAIEADACEIIDAAGLYVLPGFIDIHTHGVNGLDVMSSSYEVLDKMSLSYATKGVTAFLPATTTAPLLKIVETLEEVGSAVKRGTSGARLLGANLEGPFINRKYKGAQPEEYIIYPSPELIESLISKSDNSIRIITLAPELDCAIDIIRDFRGRGITFSAGHCGLNYNSSVQAFRSGVSHITHIFNSMPGIHQREPGLVGAALDDDDVTVEVIPDGIHVYGPIVRMIYKCKSADRMAIVTDSSMAAGLADGEYVFGGRRILVKGNESRLDNGALSGSTLTMCDAVRNCVDMFGIPLEDAVKMATATPASIINIQDRKGSLTPGKDADITIMNDMYDVKMTIVEGKTVFRTQDF
jgi:N-acetylglucosamine-6-phosphate deacetylase